MGETPPQYYNKEQLKGLIGAPKNEAQEQKPDLSLLPMDLLSIVTKAYEYGCFKYFRNSWRQGFETNRSLSAAQRHISNFQDEGQIYDGDAWDLAKQKVHHIAMAIFNLLCILDSETNHPELVENYVPVSYKSDVPLSEQEAIRMEARRLLWLYKENPVEFQRMMTTEDIIKKFKDKKS